jgi:hypothetical protein
VLTADGARLYAVLMHGDFSTSLVGYDMHSQSVTKILARTDGSGAICGGSSSTAAAAFCLRPSARAPGILVYDTLTMTGRCMENVRSTADCRQQILHSGKAVKLSRAALMSMCCMARCWPCFVEPRR